MRIPIAISIIIILLGTVILTGCEEYAGQVFHAVSKSKCAEGTTYECVGKVLKTTYRSDSCRVSKDSEVCAVACGPYDSGEGMRNMCLSESQYSEMRQRGKFSGKGIAHAGDAGEGGTGDTGGKDTTDFFDGFLERGECRDSADCPSGSYCDKEVGECSSLYIGTCTAVPTTCSKTIEYVCGCDGTTHNNACVANRARTSVATLGECPVGATCGNGDVETGETCDDGNTASADGCSSECVLELGYCMSNADCDSTWYCFRGTGAVCEGLGECRPRTTLDCSREPTAVICACDDISYLNRCFAEQAGYGLKSTGACPDEPDTDGDGILDVLDNCRITVNPDQADADDDGVGDLCDIPSCGNGVEETGEACDDGNTAAGDGCSPTCTREADTDGDGIYDPVDHCPSVRSTSDSDNDCVDNAHDMCASTPAGVAVDANGCSSTQRSGCYSGSFCSHYDSLDPWIDRCEAIGLTLLRGSGSCGGVYDTCIRCGTAPSGRCHEPGFECGYIPSTIAKNYYDNQCADEAYPYGYKFEYTFDDAWCDTGMCHRCLGPCPTGYFCTVNPSTYKSDCEAAGGTATMTNCYEGHDMCYNYDNRAVPISGFASYDSLTGYSVSATAAADISDPYEAAITTYMDGLGSRVGCCAKCVVPITYTYDPTLVATRAVDDTQFPDCTSLYGPGSICVATEVEFNDRCAGQGVIHDDSPVCLTPAEAGGYCVTC